MIKRLFHRLGIICEQSYKLEISSSRFKDFIHDKLDNRNHVPATQPTQNDYRGIIQGSEFKLWFNLIYKNEWRPAANLKGHIQEFEESSIILRIKSNGFTVASFLLLMISLTFIVSSIPLYLLIADLQMLGFLPFGLLGLATVVWISRASAEQLLEHFEIHVINEIRLKG